MCGEQSHQKRTIATSRCNDNLTDTKTVIGKHTNATIYKKKADNARRYRYVFTPMKTTRT